MNHFLKGKEKIIILMIILFNFYNRVNGTTFLVNNLNDSGVGSFREALLNSSVAGKDTIDASTVFGTILITTSLPTLDQDLVIIGPESPQNLTIQRNAVTPFRIFNINSGVHVTIINLGISKGYSDTENGGGILNNGSLTLKNCVVDSNFTGVNNFGGGIFNAPNASLMTDFTQVINGTANMGGGIYNSGTLIMLNSSTIAYNSAQYGSGIYNEDSLFIDNGYISSNGTNTTTTNEGGGGIYNTGKLYLTNSSMVYENFSDGNGGGIYMADGTAHIEETEFINNSVEGQGGAFYRKGGIVIINQTTFSSNGNNGAIGAAIYNDSGSGELNITGCVFAENFGKKGAAIYNKKDLNIYNSTFESNATDDYNSGTDRGGSIFNENVHLNIDSCIFTNNESYGLGAAIMNIGTDGFLKINNSSFSQNKSDTGSGIIVDSTSNMDIRNSTFSTNKGTVLFLKGGNSSTSSTIYNSTFSSNFSDSAAVAFIDNASASFINCTIVMNYVYNHDAVFYPINNGNVSIDNSILLGNHIAGIHQDLGNIQVSSSYGHNIIGITSSTTLTGNTNGNITNVNLTDVLSPSLKINAGSTKTHALIAHSPAINAGSNDAALLTDQCGNPRVGNADIGAFEYQSVVIVSQPAAQTVQSGESITLSVSANAATSISYQWQVDNGSGFVNLDNSGIYGNVYTSTLSISNVTEQINGYSFRCIVKDENQDTDTSSIVPVTLMITTGVASSNELVDNSNNKVIIDLNENSIYNVQIADISGKEIFETRNIPGQYSFSTNGYKNSIYMMRIQTDNKIKVQKIYISNSY